LRGQAQWARRFNHVSRQYLVKTLGCKANLTDSQLIEQALQNQGWTPGSQRGQGVQEERSDIQLCIVNTCTVTNEADKQSRKMAESLARQYPHASIVVTGCAVEVDPNAYTSSQKIHYVVGNQDKHQLVHLVLKELEKKEPPAPSLNLSLNSARRLGSVVPYSEILSQHPEDREWPLISESFLTPPVHLHGLRTRSFLKIQEGCDAFCTYCIIPYGRGPSRSLNPDEVVRQVRSLVSQGVKEIVITGTNIGDYGTDGDSHDPSQPDHLSQLLKRILDETDLQRLRVSSLDPTEITPQMMRLMESDSRFCPHFHVSVQSPHSRILRLMKRKYRAEEVRDRLLQIAELKAPVGGVFVGMDLITGFPGETEEEFQWTFETLSALPWTKLHVFPYSERSSTPATRLPGSVPQSVRVDRCRALNKLSFERQKSHYESILRQCRQSGILLRDVLVESIPKEGWSGGYTPNYLRVLFANPEKITSRHDLIDVEALDVMIDRNGAGGGAGSGGDVAMVCKLALRDDSVERAKCIKVLDRN